MTLFRGTFLDTPHDPFQGGGLRVGTDLGILVDGDGVVVERDGWAALRARHPDEPVEDLSGGLVLPGFVDTHVHYPQVRMIGALGMPLLDWLERSALPEEARLADVGYARQVAAEFLDGLVAAGTTTALVFGSHYAAAVDTLFTAADAVGLRVTSGLVVSDRELREDLLTTPQRAYDEGLALAKRWNGVGRNRYAVIPRFSLSCTEGLLDSCAGLRADVEDAWFTTHINENLEEVVAAVALFENAEDYLATYQRHGLVNTRSVFAHNIHATPAELEAMAAAGSGVAHCPTSNAALGSGLFPIKEHIAAGVHVSLGSDVGAGTGFSLFKEGLQAYFVQQLLGPRGMQLSPAHLLQLATNGGAVALGLADRIGDFEVGKQFDALHLRPPAGSTLDVCLRNAADEAAALGMVFALAGPADVAGVWVSGRRPRSARGEDGAATVGFPPSGRDLPNEPGSTARPDAGVR